jgi:protein tyrosine/serine phosphatase
VGSELHENVLPVWLQLEEWFEARNISSSPEKWQSPMTDQGSKRDLANEETNRVLSRPDRRDKVGLEPNQTPTRSKLATYRRAFARFPYANFGVVIPGKLYRCNQPTLARLERYKRQFKITTIINLRGDESLLHLALMQDAADALKLELINLPLESRGAPQRDRIMRLQAAYAQAEGAVLLYCKAGADRVGLGAGLCLLFEGGSVRSALGQLSWRHLHCRFNKTGILDAFFHRYERDNQDGRPFSDWLKRDYDPTNLQIEFERLWHRKLNARLRMWGRSVLALGLRGDSRRRRPDEILKTSCHPSQPD